jgi:hypothetical protein
MAATAEVHGRDSTALCRGRTTLAIASPRELFQHGEAVLPVRPPLTLRTSRNQSFSSVPVDKATKDASHLKTDPDGWVVIVEPHAQSL